MRVSRYATHTKVRSYLFSDNKSHIKYYNCIQSLVAISSNSRTELQIKEKQVSEVIIFEFA